MVLNLVYIVALATDILEFVTSGVKISIMVELVVCLLLASGQQEQLIDIIMFVVL